MIGKQWGVFDLALEGLQNLKMVEAVWAEAKTIIEGDAELKNFPLLREKFARKESVHLE